MKSITIREAQHNLASVLQTVESGEVVEILRRKTPVARIVPIRNRAGSENSVDWTGHQETMASVWGDRVIEGVDSVLDDLRGAR